MVGPRVFPLGPSSVGHACDQALPKETIEREFPQLELADVSLEIWEEGTNLMPEEEFSRLAMQFLEWCKNLKRERIYIVSHDGTITNYRRYLGESVTREHFLGDTGWHYVIV